MWRIGLARRRSWRRWEQARGPGDDQMARGEWSESVRRRSIRANPTLRSIALSSTRRAGRRERSRGAAGAVRRDRVDFRVGRKTHADGGEGGPGLGEEAR